MKSEEMMKPMTLAEFCLEYYGIKINKDQTIVEVTCPDCCTVE